MANSNKNKKYHFIYKTSCLFNSNYYIGMHSTSNILDGYMGSGIRINRAIKKYGVENFKCEVLEYLSDRDSLARREKEIVTEELLKDVNCLNLKPGGFGGISKEHQLLGAIAGKKAFLEKLQTDETFRKKFSETGSKSNLNRPRGFVADKTKSYDWIGKTHSSVTIERMSNAKKGTGTGINNSQFGSCWITNGCINKKLKSNSDIPMGWFKGFTK